MVILFCGIPGSGKTTIAKKLASRLRKVGSVKLWTSDNLKPPVYKKFARLLREHRGKYNFLIFDGTFYKEKWRREMKALAGNERTMLVYLKVSLPTALSRNKGRRARIPARAVHIMVRKLEEPQKPDLFIDTDKIGSGRTTQRIFQKIIKVMPV